MNNSSIAFPLNHSQLNSGQLKTFSFQIPQDEQFNPLLLENIDLEEIQASGDLNSCSSLLRNFVSAKITDETINELDYDKFSKLLQICQISMDFYTQNQEHKEKTINEKLKTLSDKQETLSKLGEIEKRHNQKIDSMKTEMGDLKKEYHKIKVKHLENVQFKCHMCPKLFKGRDFLTAHLQKNHQKDQSQGPQSDPEQLNQLLAQLQNQQQIMQDQSKVQQSNGFVGTGQSWGLSNLNGLGSKGLEQIQKVKDEKDKKKEKARQARQQKRERERNDKAKSLKVQQQMMQGMQNNINNMMELKMEEMKNIQDTMINQQLKIQQENFQIQSELQTSLHNQLQSQREKITEKQPKTSFDKFSIIDNTFDKNQENSYVTLEGELQKIVVSDNVSPISKDPKKPIKIGTVSDITSFNNYSYSQNQTQSPIKIGINLIDNKQGRQLYDLKHIGELESDNDHEEIYNDISGDLDLKPLNKQLQMKKGEEEVLQAIHNKKNIEYDKDFIEPIGFVDEQIFNQKKRSGLPTGNMDNVDKKEIKVILQKLQNTQHI